MTSLRSRILVLLSVAALVTEARPAAAQFCVGRPVAKGSPGRVGARYISYPGSQSEYGIEGGLTSTSGLFGSAGMAITHISTPDGNAKSGEVWIGQAFTPQGSTLQICPMAGVEYVSFPTFSSLGGNIDSHATLVSVGTTLGIPLGSDPSMQFVPFGGAYFQHQEVSVSQGTRSTSEGLNNGMYEIGIVVVANQRFSVGPVMRNVFGIDHSGRAAYGLIASYSLGQ
jgi:hypothetical protein